MKLIIIVNLKYTLILSYDPCDIFRYYNVTEMHGLSLADCENHTNNTEQAYIAGLTNYEPKESDEYGYEDKLFVYINLSRCTDDIHTTGLVFHEMMHCAGHIYKGEWDYYEEEMITWAEEETYKTVELIKNLTK